MVFCDSVLGKLTNLVYWRQYTDRVLTLGCSFHHSEAFPYIDIVPKPAGLESILTPRLPNRRCDTYSLMHIFAYAPHFLFQ